MSDKKNKNKSLLKDIGILLCVWGPLLFIIIGGIMWRNDRFDGTLMEVLFPALFLGFISGFATLIFISNIFQYSTVLWIVSAGLVFIATAALYLLGMTTALTVVMCVPIVLVLLMVLVKWIAGS